MCREDSLIELIPNNTPKLPVLDKDKLEKVVIEVVIPVCSNTGELESECDCFDCRLKRWRDDFL